MCYILVDVGTIVINISKSINRTLCHHAIAFSRNGAEKILAAIKHPLSKPIDHIVASLATNGIIDSYASVIPIFYQNRDEMSSTIGNYDHLPVCM